MKLPPQAKKGDTCPVPGFDGSQPGNKWELVYGPGEERPWEYVGTEFLHRYRLYVEKRIHNLAYSWEVTTSVSISAGCGAPLSGTFYVEYYDGETWTFGGEIGFDLGLFEIDVFNDRSWSTGTNIGVATNVSAGPDPCYEYRAWPADEVVQKTSLVVRYPTSQRPPFDEGGHLIPFEPVPFDRQWGEKAYTGAKGNIACRRRCAEDEADE